MMKNEANDSILSKGIKVGSTVLMLGAIALYLWQVIVPLPTFLQPVFVITRIVMIIHAIEGVIAALLIFRDRQLAHSRDRHQSASILLDHLPQSTPLAVLKAWLYAFFVGTVGLVEIIKATRATPAQTPS